MESLIRRLKADLTSATSSAESKRASTSVVDSMDTTTQEDEKTVVQNPPSNEQTSIETIEVEAKGEEEDVKDMSEVRAKITSETSLTVALISSLKKACRLIYQESTLVAPCALSCFTNQ